MNQFDDLISLEDNPSSLTPPPNYPNAFRSNAQNIASNKPRYSSGLNQSIPPMFQNSGFPQRQPQNQQPPIHYQSGIPVIEIDKLPLSMKRNYHIQNNYPTGFIVFHSLSLLFISFLMIAAEMVILNDSSNRNTNNQIGGGLYSAGFIILTVFINLLSISCRNFCMVVTSVFLHLVSLSLTFILTVVIHALAIQESGCSFGDEDCESDRLFVSGVFLIGISLVAVLMCLYYSIFIQIKIIGGCFKKSQNSRQFVPIIPNPQNGFNNPNYNYQPQLR